MVEVDITTVGEFPIYHPFNVKLQSSALVRSIWDAGGRKPVVVLSKHA